LEKKEEERLAGTLSTTVVVSVSGGIRSRRRRRRRNQPTLSVPTPLEPVAVAGGERGTSHEHGRRGRELDVFHRRPREDPTLQKSCAGADENMLVLYSFSEFKFKHAC
jgi:hypothetical protein